MMKLRKKISKVFYCVTAISKVPTRLSYLARIYCIRKYTCGNSSLLDRDCQHKRLSFNFLVYFNIIFGLTSNLFRDFFIFTHLYNNKPNLSFFYFQLFHIIYVCKFICAHYVFKCKFVKIKKNKNTFIIGKIKMLSLYLLSLF